VVGLTLLALGLRLPGLSESLFGDELYTYAIATQHSVHGAYDVMQSVENNPPLFYAVAWVMAKLGDPTLTIRLPSLVLASATVPLLYLLGRRTVGVPAALVATAVFAISPTAIFYGVEARSYALLMFLVTLSTLLLVEALERPRRLWLGLYALAASLMLYTHYTGIFVAAAQGAWALWAHRGRARELVVAYGAVALTFVFWIPAYRDQPPFHGWLGAPPWTASETVRDFTIALIGHTYRPLAAVPGRFAVGLLAVTAAVGAAFAAVEFLRRPRARRRVQPRLVLLVAVALAPPLALLVNNALGADAYGPRNLGASLPPLCLVLGALVTPLDRRVAAALSTALLAAFAIGAGAMLDHDSDRPPFKTAAHVIDREDHGAGAVLEYPLFGPSGPTGRSLEINFERPHYFIKTSLDDRTLPARVSGRSRLFVVAPWVSPWKGAPLPQGLDRRYRLVRKRVWPSWIPVALLEYQRRG
jgi:mannosyltransferase